MPNPKPGEIRTCNTCGKDIVWRYFRGGKTWAWLHVEAPPVNERHAARPAK